MPTPKSVSDIKSNLLRPALTSHFEVSIGVPQFLSNTMDGYTQQRLYLQCCETALPGSRLATFEIKNDHHGVTEKHAYRRIFDDRIDLTFMVDADNYWPIRFFETWIRGIVDEDDIDEDSNTDSNARNYFYRSKYPDGAKGYCTDGLEVTKFERDYNRNFLTYKFIKAYPFSINSMPVSYDGSNLLKCTVGFTYIRYVTDNTVYDPPQGEPKQNVPAGNPTDTNGRREDLDIWSLSNRDMVNLVGNKMQKDILNNVDAFYNTGERQNRLQSLANRGGYASGTAGFLKGVAMPGLTLNFKNI
jgi:hypothetical protein